MHGACWTDMNLAQALTPAVLAAALLLFSGCAQPAGSPQAVSGEALEARGPILIDGANGLTPANGVRTGSGTDDDPFIIDNWLIDLRGASASAGIHIKNTDRHIHVKSCKVLVEKTGKIGIHLQRAKNVRIQGCVLVLVPSSTATPTSESASTPPPAGTTTPSTAAPESSGIPFPQGPSPVAILVEGSHNTVVEQVDVQGQGIVISNGNTTQILDSAFDGGFIVILDSDDTTLQWNDIVNGGADDQAAVVVTNSTNVHVSNNTLDFSLDGGIEVRGSENVTVVENSIANGGGNGITLAESTNLTAGNNTLDGNTGSGLEASNLIRAVIVDNEATNNSGAGITLANVTDATIANNSATGNAGAGITAMGMSNSNVTNNDASGNDADGIVLEDSENNTVASNTATNNGGYGIALEGDDNEVTQNIVTGNGAQGGGGLLVDGAGNAIATNTLADNHNYAIVIMPGSGTNIVSDNTVSGTDGGDRIIVPSDPTNDVTGQQGRIEEPPPSGFNPRPAPDADRTIYVLIVLGIGGAGAAIAYMVWRQRRFTH